MGALCNFYFHSLKQQDDEVTLVEGDPSKVNRY